MGANRVRHGRVPTNSVSPFGFPSTKNADKIAGNKMLFKVSFCHQVQGKLRELA